jgi:hypothetical protein
MEARPASVATPLLDGGGATTVVLEAAPSNPDEPESAPVAADQGAGAAAVTEAAAEPAPVVATPAPAYPTRVGPFLLDQTPSAVVGGLRFEATGAPETAVAGRAVTVTLSPLAETSAATAVAALAATLPSRRHPALLPVLGAGVENGWTYVVQPPARTRTLADRLASEGGLPPPLVEAAVVELAGALSTLHEAGLIHGDVRPTNILVDADQRNVLAGVVLGASAAGAIPDGADPYVAPERRHGPPTPATDQFALAATVATMLAGTPPRLSAAGEMVPLDLGMPAPVVDALQRGLVGEPERRFPTVDAFVAAFRQAIDTGADALVAGVYEAIARRDQVMATLLLDGVRRLRPNHPQLAIITAQMRGDPSLLHGASLPIGLAGAMPSFDASPPIFPSGFEMPMPAPVTSTSRGANPWITFGVAVALCTILLVAGVLLVFMFAGQ